MIKNSYLPQTKHNNNTVMWCDGFATETVSREGFSSFVKLFLDSTNRMHETQKSQTGFG